MDELTRESEKQSCEMVDRLPVMVFEIDLEGNISFINNTGLNVLGNTRNEVLGRPFHSLFVPEDADRCISLMHTALAGIIPRDSELLMMGRNGELINSLVRSLPERNTRGALTGVRGIVLDLSRQNKAEAALSESEVKYRTLLNHIDPGIVRITAGGDGRFMEFNRALERMSGYTRDELLSMKIGSLLTELNGDKTRPPAQASSGLAPYREMKLKRKDGRDLKVSLRLTPLKSNEGDILYLDGIIEDITERSKSEEILKESENKFRTLAEQSSNMIFINTGSSIAYVNNRCEEILGYSKEEFCAPDFNFLSIIAPESREMVAQNFALRKQGEPIGAYEYTLISRDGKRIPAIISMNLIRYRNGNAFLGTVTDITERKKMEQKIIELYEKEKKERQELQEEARSRGLYMDVLAHELRTPLTPILVSAGLLKNYTGEQGEEVRLKLMDNIYRSAQTLAVRLEELLDLARYSRGTFKLNLQPMAFGPFIREVLLNYKPSLLPRKQNLVENIPENLPVVRMDASRLEQVVINLLSNASKFSRDGDAIFCSVTTVDREIQVDVRDNGIGIPLDSQERLFQPYHRVEQDRQLFPGLGLGLSVASQIVEAHGGRIWLKSQPGAGSTFSFRIPLAGPAAPKG